MSQTLNKIKTMVTELNIPSTITEDQYPKLDLSTCDGNVFMLIGAVGRVWRRVDSGVASRIGGVVSKHAESYEEAVLFLSQIIQDPDYGEDAED